MAQDPRVSLVRSQMEGRNDLALAQIERLLSEQPELAKDLGLSYLQAHLLDSVGASEAVNTALLRAITETPALAAYSYFRMALDQERLGHPETAAGLVARVVA